MEVVEAADPGVADRVGVADDQITALAQQRHDVRLQLLPPIRLAVLQRGGGGRGIGDDVPLDALDMSALAARGPFGRLVARDIAVEAGIGDAAAGDELVLQEPVWPGAHHIGDLGIGVGSGETLRHHHRDHAVGLGDRVEQ